MKRLGSAVFALALWQCAGVASAQPIQNIALRNSFDPLGAGARGLGLGGAFIAVADDGTAATFNPPASRNCGAPRSPWWASARR